ncbi:hypothetical protein ABKN59_006497 [Abortiporus biennis]
MLVVNTLHAALCSLPRTCSLPPHCILIPSDPALLSTVATNRTINDQLVGDRVTLRSEMLLRFSINSKSPSRVLPLTESVALPNMNMLSWMDMFPWMAFSLTNSAGLWSPNACFEARPLVTNTRSFNILQRMQRCVIQAIVPRMPNVLVLPCWVSPTAQREFSHAREDEWDGLSHNLTLQRTPLQRF